MSEPGWITDLLDRLKGSSYIELPYVFDKAAGLAGQLLPNCQIVDCQNKAFLPIECPYCCRYCCFEHGWFSALPGVICQECFCEIEKRATGGEEEGIFNPFSILNIDPKIGSFEKQANKFFRQASKVLHPDRIGQNEAASHLFSIIRKCKELIIATSK